MTCSLMCRAEGWRLPAASLPLPIERCDPITTDCSERGRLGSSRKAEETSFAKMASKKRFTG